MSDSKLAGLEAVMGKVKAWVARVIMALPPVRWANKIDGERRDREIRAIFE